MGKRNIYSTQLQSKYWLYTALIAMYFSRKLFAYIFYSRNWKHEQHTGNPEIDYTGG